VFRHLLSGHDTIEVCYYLRQTDSCFIDYQDLWMQRELLRVTKNRTPKIIDLCGESFVLKPNGSRNGFPFVMENETYIVEFGEFNHPSFRVKFRSQPLWQHGALALHKRFLDWVDAVGLYAIQPESLSRVDFTFDYHLPQIDFDEDSVVSQSKKDNKYRDDGKINGLVYGKSDIVLRIYDKVLEIAEQSGKVWMFQLWGGVTENVWRIEWQARQAALRRFGIRTFDDLMSQQGDLLRYLAAEHDTLRIKTEDSNRSRWPVHPLWQDLIERINSLECQGVYRVVDEKEVLKARLMRIAISVYGNLKRIGALHAVQHQNDFTGFDTATDELHRLLKSVHDPLTWRNDVDSRIKEIRFGQW
jgi:hypothetical protein